MLEAQIQPERPGLRAAVPNAERSHVARAQPSIGMCGTPRGKHRVSTFGHMSVATLTSLIYAPLVLTTPTWPRSRDIGSRRCWLITRTMSVLASNRSDRSSAKPVDREVWLTSWSFFQK
jgi:hypothetical protein